MKSLQIKRAENFKTNQPSMADHNLAQMAAKAAGIDFAELVWRILETSLAA
jgi:hypothetical protein